MADPKEPGETTGAAGDEAPNVGSSASATATTSAPPDIIAAAPPEDGEGVISDGDSALGDDAASSTASVASSIFHYRTIHGRSFHSERPSTQYFTPVDNQQLESVDISHHALTVLLGDKLFLAPIGDDVKKVVDIGTGTGIWAIDFADAYPNAEVIGTDLSAIQPSWVPPNVKFEIDDATLPWTWAEDTFDFVHMRYLFGTTGDWDEMFRQAFRVTAPGGWIQSCECDVDFLSDDGTTAGVYALDKWNLLFREGGKKSGRPITLIEDNTQVSGMEKAGYVDVEYKDLKLPIGAWAADERLRDVGGFTAMTMLNDIEGYTLFMWNQIVEWPMDEYQIFLMEMRKALRNRSLHGYMKLRYVWARKPGGKGKAPA